MPLQFQLLPPPTPKLLRRFQRDAGWKAGDADTTVAADTRGSVQWVGVRRDDRTVCLARLELAPPHFCLLSELIVLSEFRAQGIGTWLLSRVEDLCRKRRIAHLLLQAAAGTATFYEGHAFQRHPALPDFYKKDLA